MKPSSLSLLPTQKSCTNVRKATGTDKKVRKNMFNLDYVINSPKWVHEKGGKRATKITFLLMIHKLFMNFASHPIYYPLSHIRSCFYAFCDTYDCVSLQKNKNHRNEPCNFSRSFFYGAIFRSFISFLFRYILFAPLFTMLFGMSQ